VAFDDCTRALRDPYATLGNEIAHLGTTREGCHVFRTKSAHAAHVLRELGFRFGTHRVVGGYVRGWK
jgi:hypothetical protein